MSEKFITNLVYSLKRRYGHPIRWFHLVATMRNLDTGLLTATYLTQAINRAVVFPEKMDRSFIYDLSYIKANSNFIYGGEFDRKVTKMIIDGRDMQLGVTIKLNDYIEYKTKRLEVKDIEHYCDDRVLILSTVSVDTEADPVSSLLGPALTVGHSAGETIAVGDLVFQNGGDIYLATQDDITKPCLGIVVSILAGAIYHTPTVSVPSLEVLGAMPATNRTLWLGLAGKATFVAPTTNLIQEIGFATSKNLDDTYVASINISANVSYGS